MGNLVKHELEPIYDSEAQILILGTMPSKYSRQVHFYYGHPQNRFWRVLELIFQEKITDRKAFLLKHHIALWDVLASCEINGSSDQSIKNETVNDIPSLLAKTNIKVIFTTGQKAHFYYQKYFHNQIAIPEINLPSTSPANCAYSLEDLRDHYQKILDYLQS